MLDLLDCQLRNKVLYRGVIPLFNSKECLWYVVNFLLNYRISQGPAFPSRVFLLLFYSSMSMAGLETFVLS